MWPGAGVAVLPSSSPPGSRGADGVDRLGQAWAGGSPAEPLRVPVALCPPLLDMCVHMYICTCDFSLDLFVFL